MSSEELAWLECEGRTYWSRSSGGSGGAAGPGCESSVIRLVSGLYHLDPRWARKRVRSRIFTTEPLRESSWGTVKVAARRVDFRVERPGEFGSDAIEVAPRAWTADRVLAERAIGRLAGAGVGGERAIWNALDGIIADISEIRPRLVALPVAAVLLDREGTALSWGANSAWDFRTEHAETNLIARWKSQGSPGVPAALWVTRKSCKMCAGWIWDAFFGAGHAIEVRHRDPDDGPMARITVLDEGSFENRRARRAAEPSG